MKTWVKTLIVVAAVAVVAGIATVGLLASSGGTHHAARQQPPAVPAISAPAPAPAALAAPNTPKAAPPKPAVPAMPVRVRIPEIGVDAPVMALGIEDGAIGAPPLTEGGNVSWFTGSSRPGASGPAVISGHVDTDAGPAVFYHLSALHDGDTIDVTRADGSVATFVVDNSEFVVHATFPANDLLKPGGASQLWLVTCAPPFDYSTHEYLDNLLVHAHLTGVQAAKH
jgi:LPXTG-site transpeptidase (sortase) family protein